MATTKIVHAVSDRSQAPGDPSGKELLVQNFYVREGGWGYLLLPPSDLREIAEAAVQIGIQIASNNAYGYSQDRRWTGYKVINSYLNSGLDVPQAIEQGYGDFDCSSFVISCYKFAGLPIKASGYTGSMLKVFKEQNFSVIDGPLNDFEAQKGAIWLAPKTNVSGGHTALCISDGPEYDPIPRPEPIPEDIPYVEVYKGKVNVRKEPSLQAGKWRIDGHSSAHAIKRFPYIGSVQNGGDLWLVVFVDETHTKTGYINFSNKMKAYVRLVEK